MKHSSLVRALVAVLCCVGFAQTALADRLDELKLRGKLLVGVSDTTPPFAFKAAVNQALLELEASGEAAKIWDTWFGPGTAQPVKRSFRITAEY